MKKMKFQRQKLSIVIDHENIVNNCIIKCTYKANKNVQ